MSHSLPPSAPSVVPGKAAVVSSAFTSPLPTARRMAFMSELLPAFCAPTCRQKHSELFHAGPHAGVLVKEKAQRYAGGSGETYHPHIAAAGHLLMQRTQQSGYAHPAGCADKRHSVWLRQAPLARSPARPCLQAKQACQARRACLRGCLSKTYCTYSSKIKCGHIGVQRKARIFPHNPSVPTPAHEGLWLGWAASRSC